MSTFKINTGREIQEAFELFHKNNPHVYVLFKEQIFKAMKNHKKKISSKMLINWLRWEVYLITKDDAVYTDSEGVEYMFRINDAYTSRYSRLFADEYPEHAELFNYRTLRAV